MLLRMMMPVHRLPVHLLMALLALLASGCCRMSADEVLPSGFTDVVVAQYFSSPAACVQAPDGRVFVGEQAGNIFVVVNGVRQAQAFATLNADGYSDRGILGLCCDPAFSSNHYLYVFYTQKATPSINVVSRFDASGATAGAETVIFQGDPLSTTFCNGGGIGFGPDGKLYVCCGDGEVDANAQSMSTTLGKLLRMNADGSVPSDNPFLSSTTGTEQLIYALGFRNIFSFAINPASGLIFCNDVRGTNNLQVVDQVGAGSDFGYPSALGASVPAPYVAPLFGIPYGTDNNQAKCLTGGLFYQPGTNAFPASYDGQYFFCDFSNGWLWTLDPSNANAVAVFASGLPNPVDLCQGVDGSIYYIGRGDSSLHSITYAAVPTQSQVITGFTTFASQVYGNAPLAIAGVSGGASGQPVVFISSNPSLATVSGSTVTMLGAGSVVITASQAGSAGYSPASPVSQTLTITPAALTVSAMPVSRPYGSANPPFTLSASGLVNGDLISSAQETTTALPTSQPGSYALSIANAVFSAGSSANYTTTYQSSSVQVMPATLVVTGDTQTMMPGDPVPVLGYTISGFVNGDTQASATTGAPTLANSVTSSSPVGSYTTTVGIGTLAASDYTFTLVNGSVLVGTVLTVSADAQTMVYGSPLPSLSYSITGFLPGDTVANAVTGSAILTTTATAQSPVGSYDISIAQGTLVAVNANTYVFVLDDGTLTVTPAPLTISATDQSMVAGQALPTLTASYSGFVAGDGPGRLTTQPQLTTTATAASPPGTYPITVSAASDANYAITFQPGVLTIVAASATTTTATGTGNGSTTGTVTTTSTTGGGGCGLGGGGVALLVLTLIWMRSTVGKPTMQLLSRISSRISLRSIHRR